MTYHAFTRSCIPRKRGVSWTSLGYMARSSPAINASFERLSLQRTGRQSQDQRTVAEPGWTQIKQVVISPETIIHWQLISFMVEDVHARDGGNLYFNNNLLILSHRQRCRWTFHFALSQESLGSRKVSQTVVCIPSSSYHCTEIFRYANMKRIFLLKQRSWNRERTCMWRSSESPTRLDS
jgi:hypothetical protein